VFGQNVFVGWGKAGVEGNGCEVSECWFCLSSATIKTHLIVSVSDEAYLAIPRGGMADFHCLIVPIPCVASRKKLRLGTVRTVHVVCVTYASLDNFIITTTTYSTLCLQLTSEVLTYTI
jgi:hypothetical protein